MNIIFLIFSSELLLWLLLTSRRDVRDERQVSSEVAFILFTSSVEDAVDRDRSNKY